MHIKRPLTRIFHTLPACAGAVLTMLGAGCMSPQPVHGTTAFVRIVSSHTAVVQGARTSLSGVGRALKTAGAGPGTAIEIALAGNSSQSAVSDARRSILRAGFRNVFVVARVTVSGDGVVSVLGDRIQLAQLGARLERMGAARDTGIQVAFDKNVQPEMVTSLTQYLVHAGFPKVIVSRRMAPTVSIQTK